jgi:two-component system chemotaxis response regulator CheY
MCPTNHLAPFGHSALLAETESSPYAAKAHFLIVDDISSMRRVIGCLLKDQLRNVRISEATDGENALQMIKSAEEGGMPIDFVVTDWNMPHMDGITLLRTIREAEPMRHLPVLLVTAEATKEMILEAAKAGADGYIVKPFNATTLKTKLEQIFAKRNKYH